MGIGIANYVYWCDTCNQSTPIPNPPPNACPLVLDGTGDSLTWAEPRLTPIAPFNLDFTTDFWFTNKEPVAKSFTILSLGKEASGQFYDTIELKYDSADNKLVVEIKADLAGTPATGFAEFELYSAQNSSITGLTSISDKWIECAGNCNLNGSVSLYMRIPNNAVGGTNILTASQIIIWWNGQPLTASSTQDVVWDANASYYTNFFTLGDYRGPNTPATAGAVKAEFLSFFWRTPSFPLGDTFPIVIYNEGYPPAQIFSMRRYGWLVNTSNFPISATLTTITPNADVPGQLNDNAAIVCGPVPYYCAPTPPPSTFTATVKSTDYHPLPANCDMWTADVTLNGTLICEVVKNPSAVATVTNPSFQVLATDVIEVTVTALAPTGASCAAQYSSTEVFMQTGFGNTNVNPFTTRLNFSSVATQSYSFSPVENVDDTINIYGTPIV